MADEFPQFRPRMKRVEVIGVERGAGVDADDPGIAVRAHIRPVRAPPNTPPGRPFAGDPSPRPPWGECRKTPRQNTPHP